MELPEEVVSYLQEDGVVLPQGFEMSCGQGAQGGDSDSDVDWGDGGEGDDEDERVSAFSGIASLCATARVAGDCCS